MTDTALARRLAHVDTKAKYDRDDYLHSSIRLVEGVGRYHQKPRPFSYDAAVVQYTSWIYAACNIKAQAASRVPLRLYMRTTVPSGKTRAVEWRTRPVDKLRKRYLRGQLKTHAPHRCVMTKAAEFGDDFEEVTELHPALEVLLFANPFMGGYDLTMGRHLYKVLTGNAYLHPIFDQELGRPVELWPMPAQWTWKIPSRETFIDGYVYGQVQADQLRFEPDEVIAFQLPNPKNLYYGMGDVEACWSAIGLHNADRQQQTAMFENGTRPDYVVFVEGANDSQLDAFQQRAESMLRGPRNAGRMLTVGGKNAVVTPLQWPPKELGDREQVVEEIAAITGVPVSKLKANDPNRANAEAGDYAFMKDAVQPLLIHDEGPLNDAYLPLFGIEPDEAFLAYDNCVPEDRQFDVDMRTRYVAGGIRSINEVRAEDGDQPFDNPLADQPLINGQPLGQSQQQASQQQSPFGLTGFDLRGAIVDAVKATVDERLKMFHMNELDAPSKKGKTNDSDNHLGSAAVGDENIKNAGGVLADQDSAAPVGRTVAESRRGSGIPKGVPAEKDLLHGSDDANRGSDCAGACVRPECAPVSQLALAWGEVKCECHAGVETKADADDTVREGEPESPMLRMQHVIEEHLAECIRIATAPFRKRRKDRAVEIAEAQQASLDEIAKKIEAMNERLAQALQPILADIISAGGASALSGLNLTANVFDVHNPEVTAWLEKYTMRLAGAINNTTIDRIRSTLVEGIGAGESNYDLAKRIEETPGFTPDGIGSRAQMIARSESARAYSHGAQEGWKQSGVVEGKTWALAPSACEFCRAVAEQYADKSIPINEPFYKQGATLTGLNGGTMVLDYADVMGPPLHPQDRCSVRPVLRKAE